MSKSTLIKDLKPPSPPPIEQPDEDVTVQEVLSEIEKEITPTDQISNQILQQQLLQQQLLQQQLLQQQQQVPNTTEDSKSNFVVNIISQLMSVFKDQTNYFVLIVVLHLVFQNINIVNILKIDNVPFVTQQPIVVYLLKSVVFALILIVCKAII